MTHSSATTQGMSGLGCACHEGVNRNFQSSSLTEASSYHCLVWYLGHSLGESDLTAEMQLVYSIAPSNGAQMA